MAIEREGLYNAVRERVEGLDVAEAADAIKDYWEELTHYWAELTHSGTFGEPQLLSMVKDVGSTWRVDWREVAEHWVEEA